MPLPASFIFFFFFCLRFAFSEYLGMSLEYFSNFHSDDALNELLTVYFGNCNERYEKILDVSWSRRFWTTAIIVNDVWKFIYWVRNRKTFGRNSIILFRTVFLLLLQCYFSIFGVIGKLLQKFQFKIVSIYIFV